MAIKCQGWLFFEDCDLRPAFRIAWTTSSGRGSEVKLRSARLRRIASETFMGSLLKNAVLPVKIRSLDQSALWHLSCGTEMTTAGR
jgi:hypothetical protein